MNPYRNAADTMRARGWRRGGLRNDSSGVCLLNALFVANDNDSVTSLPLLYAVASEMYPEHVPNNCLPSVGARAMHLVTWNDYHCTGADDAIALLEKAATRYDDQQVTR
jgi:hypothetical protein